MIKKFSKKIISVFLTGLLTVCFVCSALASDAETETTTGNAEELKAYVKELLVLLDSSNTTLDQLYAEIAELDVKIAENEVSLAAAEESAEYQHQQMLKRIKYFYEAGSSMDVLDAIFSAESIGDAINKSAYINKVVDYDREMLRKYETTINTINELQTELITARDRLEQAKAEFEETNEEMLEAVEEMPEVMAEYGVEEQDVYKVIEEVHEEMVETGELPEETTQVIELPTEIITEPVTEAATETKTETPTEETPTEETPTEQETKEVPVRGTGYSDEEIYNLARVTYLENGCAYPYGSYRSIYLTACVILNRANNWYDGSINAALFADGQYATAYKYTNWGGGALTINDITWQAVEEALSDCDPNPYYQCNGSHLDGMGLTEYYRDPASNEVFYYSYDNAPQENTEKNEEQIDDGTEDEQAGDTVEDE